MNVRLRYVDIAKAIVIILMVLGHSSIPKTLSDWIFSFHMPFFFIISGVMTKWGNAAPKAFILHKMKSLLLPFLIYSVCNVALYPLYGDETLSAFALHTLTNGWGGYALWFVPVLFFSLCLAKVFVDKKLQLLGIIVLTLLGALLDFYDCCLPWTICTIPIATAFVLIGARFREQLLFAEVKHSSVLLLGGLVGGGILSFLSRTDLASNHVNPIYITLPAALLGYTFIMILSRALESKLTCSISGSIARVGQETFVVLAFSQAIIRIINVQFVFSILLKYLFLVFTLIFIVYIKNKIKNAYIHNSHITTS